MMNIDFVIISNAKNKELSDITTNCIQSLLNSECSSIFKFKIIVIESNLTQKPYDFTQTIYTEDKFGYNKFLNIGLKYCASEFVCFCNNDLVFQKNWLTEIMKISVIRKDIMSFSSQDPWLHKQYNDLDLNQKYIEGYDKMKIFTGWFFMIKRELLSTIGLFDENLEFWYCDDDYINTLRKFDIKHALVTKSIVKHLGSHTLKLTQNTKEYISLTSKQYLYFDYKWHHNSKFIYNSKRLWFFFKNYL
mgnify:FL=1